MLFSHTRSCFLLLIVAIVGYYTFDGFINGGSDEIAQGWQENSYSSRRRLDDSNIHIVAATNNNDNVEWFGDVPHILGLAQQSSQQTSEQLKVLFVVTSLVEYDKGTRGTQHGYDRLQHVVLSQLSDSVKSMVDKGWKVDVYLVLGYKSLASDRRQMIQNALPNGVGLEVWEDAIPYHYEKTYNYKHPRDDQTLKIADHALSRQHRFVLRDKLPFYDFFACFVSTI